MLAPLLWLALAQAPAPAEATRLPQGDVGVMREQMHEYFDGEWREAYFWLAGGVPGLAAGAGLLAGGNSGFKGASAPLLLFGLIQSAAGVFLFSRTRGQVGALDALLDSDPAAYLAQEGKRVEGVNRGFELYRPVELAFLAAGVVLTAEGTQPRSDALVGLGIALVAESLVMLVFDHFAGTRAELYQARIRAFATGSASISN